MDEKPVRQIKFQEAMAYISCFWSIFVIPLFILLRIRIKSVFKKGLLKRVMKKYSALLDELFLVVSLQIIIRITAYLLVIYNDFFFNALYMRATMQIVSIFFLVIITRTIEFKTQHLDPNNEEGDNILDNSQDDWQNDFKMNIPLNQLENQTTLQLISNVNLIYNLLIGLTDVCQGNA